MTNQPPAGWYPDHEVPGGQRYWTGTSWTDHRVAFGEPLPTTRGAGRVVLAAVALVVVGLLGLGAVGALAGVDVDDDDDATSETVPVDDLFGSTTTAPATTTTERSTTTTTERRHQDRYEGTPYEGQERPTTTTTTTTTTTPPPPPTTDPMQRERVAMGLWAAENQHLLDAFVDSQTEIADAAEDGDVFGVGVACAGLGLAVDDAVAADPIPVADIDLHWQAALYHYGLAADLCVDGAANFDPTALQQSVDEMNLGTEEITSASDAMNRYL